MPRDPLHGQTEALLLSAVGSDGAHGYEIIDRLRERSGGVFDLAEGTVYPVLHRLERDGLLSSSWSEHRGRRRRVYRLTGDGARALDGMRHRWRRFAASIEVVLGGGAA